MSYLISTLLFVTFISCSQINTQSRDHYVEKKKMRHGIVPVQSANVKSYKATPANKERVQSGQKIYMKNCYSCHGIDGTGQGPNVVDLETKPKNLIEIVKKVPNFKFYMSVSQWQGKMPGWINVLTEQELEDVKAYLQHLSNKS